VICLAVSNKRAPTARTKKVDLLSNERVDMGTSGPRAERKGASSASLEKPPRQAKSMPDREPLHPMMKGHSATE
ncbi:hypothetical protein RUM43_009604, partial [Polyplax serrata]